ncbi:MAG TPA: DUF1080 domain-containing protein [Terriglobia bacterium]|nr:DUF1080 domain-containing protein [Terriglobia bacterium]
MRRMLLAARFGAIAAIFVVLALLGLNASAQESVFKYPPNDRSRPQPHVITPGGCSMQASVRRPPSDATILFNGKDLSDWKSIKGGSAPWKAQDGYFEVVPGTGDIETRQSFKDFQLHVEWTTPAPPHGEDQNRGNSGIYLQGLYEIQVLDSFHSKTYPDGQAGAVYGEYPPLVNASCPPGQWQTYDIIFRAPRFMPNGNLLRPARVTVIQNGVLVQDNVAITGPTRVHDGKRPPYPPGVSQGPLRLQDHHHPVRYRNIWMRELGAGE